MSSKPISFGFGKPKGQSSSTSTSTSQSTSIPGSTKTSISLPTKAKAPLHKSAPTHKIRPSALHGDDDDDQDDEEPKHEELTGFSSSGAILSKPVEQKKELVIENAGNQDWRRKAQARHGKGQNLLPAEVQAQKRGDDVVMVEKNEVSTASGLQFARAAEKSAEASMPAPVNSEQDSTPAPKNTPKTADEEALQALLADDPNAPRGTAIIEAQDDARDYHAPGDPEDFASLVATHPDSSTLDEYAAMPVEEFGLAMLRGMGKKRRANGEVITLETAAEQKEVKKRKQDGYLGIGAKTAPGMEGVELGAWGKSDMRRNQKGQGFFTPVMVRDRETGETITEEELERRKKGAKHEGDDDWRERRDRNLGKGSEAKNGGGAYRDKMNEFSRRAPDDDGARELTRSKRHRSRSRSRSRERRRRDDDDGYDSKSSRGHRDRDRDRDGHRRDRDRDRERDYDRSGRRHRDRR